MMPRSFAILLLIISVNACSLAPKHTTPALPVPDSWSEEAIAIEQEQMLAEIKWQDFFQSPELREIIEVALDNNKDLKLAALNIEAARALYRIKKGAVYPTLEAVGSGSRRHSSDKSSSTGKGFITSTYDANLSMSFELDLFGRIKNLNTVAIEEFLSTTEARNAVQVSLIAEVANAYLQWLADHESLKVSTQILKTQEDAHALISKSFENGIVGKLDVLQAKTLVESIKANIAFLNRKIAQDKNALILLLGNHDKTILPEEPPSLSSVELASTLPTDLPSTVLLLRPDIKSAEHQLRGMNANVGVARASFFPRISLTAAYGFSSSSLASLFSSGALGAWSFAPKIAQPIFEGGSNMANLRHAHAKKQIAITQYEKAIQTAFREVADELVAKESIHEQLESSKNLVQTAQETYDLASLRHQNGIVRYINVLDSQRTLLSAELNKIEIEKIQLSNLINLYKALGGGWQEQDTK